MTTPGTRSEVAQKIDLEQLRYSTVWEDHAMLEAALQIDATDDVLSIASAGDNVFALLLQEPRSITAIDMSPAQIALMQLKLAGIRELSRDDFLALLGFGDGALDVYSRLRPALPEEVARFWDVRGDELQAGVVRVGRLETYFRAFSEKQLPQLWPHDLVERLFAASDLAEQRRLFEAEAFTPAFQKAFSEYFGRESMAKRGRTPEQFQYVDAGDVGGYFLQRFHHVCTTSLLRGNFYVERFLTGENRALDEGPLYLRPSEFERLKGLVDRVDVLQAELETHLSTQTGTYSKVQLSDVFEYMSAEASDALFTALARAIRPGGRLAYWNLLVPRARPEFLADRIVPREDEAARLWAHDRAWFYRAFRIEEVVG